jgi:alpha-L-fucosidase
MSTFDGDELSKGDQPAALYAPDKLDVGQWVQVARDAGMKYAVLTAKHVAGFCLWPTGHTDYRVSNSENTTDVVEAFVKACERHGIMPGLYYCSWDNHHLLGSVTPTYTRYESAFTTSEYRDFQMAQIEELLTRYGQIGEVWIDIPYVLGPDGRRKQYNQIARLQPDAVIMMNSGFGDGSQLKVDHVWPTDLMAIERWLPNSATGYNPWHKISHGGRMLPGAASQHEYNQDPPQDYYVPGEVCDPIGRDWFWSPSDRLRTDAELLGMRLICRERKANLLLNVPPDKHGLIPQDMVGALIRLRKNMERLGL